ncbi:hypothetical protein FB470_004532 [Amycolatopsis thermophila]|uniref:Uncharacterized protein n=1 Tax=Amycolatopsis thermophila TaxID=206084 RepID=A0ABU0EYZ8_9PSEU|nr:hypothetical protein [Amycolatopsis thermophila]
MRELEDELLAGLEPARWDTFREGLERGTTTLAALSGRRR